MKNEKIARRAQPKTPQSAAPCPCAKKPHPPAQDTPCPPPNEALNRAPPFTAHFHWLASFWAVRGAALLLLLPLLRALFAWGEDGAAFFALLWQESLLLCVAFAYARRYHHTRRVHFCAQPTPTLTLEKGVLRLERKALLAEGIAALTLDDTIALRALGAARLTLYFAAPVHDATAHLLLPRAGAAALAELLLPTACAEHTAPTARGDAVRRALLGTNVLGTAALLFAAVWQSSTLSPEAQALALLPLQTALALSARLSPDFWVRLRATLALLGILSLLRSVFHSARFRLWKTKGVLCLSHGIFHRHHTRVRLCAVLYYDAPRTPLSRLLRRTPVYLRAGSYHARRVPLLLLPFGARRAPIAAFLPQCDAPPLPRQPLKSRSLFPFFAPCGVALGLCALCALAAVYWQFSPSVPLCALWGGALVCALLWCALAAEGFCKEGITRQSDGFSLCFLRWFTLHHLHYLAPLPPVRVWQSPFARFARRGTLRLSPLRGVNCTIHSVLLKTLDEI